MRVGEVRYLRKFAAAASLAMAVIAGPITPQPVAAAGLTNLLAGLCVTEGCSQFTGPLGTPVPVRYFLPKADCPSPAVIILHGIDGGARYDNDYAEIGKGLAAEGYAAFIVYYFEGAPGTVRPHPDDRGLPDPKAFFPWVQTVKGAVSYVQSFSCVDPARVGVMGLSLGGFVASSAASNDPRVRSAVVLSGGMPDIYGDQLQYMPPTLIVHGDQDADVPVWEAYKLHDRMSRKGLWHDLEILPCEGHLPYKTYKAHAAKKVLNFFNKTL
jgi:dienelactone hydrolase